MTAKILRIHSDRPGDPTIDANLAARIGRGEVGAEEIERLSGRDGFSDWFWRVGQAIWVAGRKRAVLEETR